MEFSIENSITKIFDSYIPILQCGHWYSSAKTQPTKSVHPTLLSQNNTKPEEIFKRGTISRDNIRSHAWPEDQKEECKLKLKHTPHWSQKMSRRNSVECHTCERGENKSGTETEEWSDAEGGKMER